MTIFTFIIILLCFPVFIYADIYPIHADLYYGTPTFIRAVAMYAPTSQTWGQTLGKYLDAHRQIGEEIWKC